MKIIGTFTNDDDNEHVIATVNGVRYVPLRKANLSERQQHEDTIKNDSFVPSKVLVIENLSITACQPLNEDFTFKVDTKFGILSDNKTIPRIDIMTNTNIDFDEDLTLEKLKYIIRRCGILEQYKEFFINDPEIIINSYTLNVRKDYQFFEEFMNGVLIAEDIFVDD
jgi:hypothetical protein